MGLLIRQLLHHPCCNIWSRLLRVEPLLLLLQVLVLLFVHLVQDSRLVLLLHGSLLQDDRHQTDEQVAVDLIFRVVGLETSEICFYGLF